MLQRLASRFAIVPVFALLISVPAFAQASSGSAGSSSISVECTQTGNVKTCKTTTCYGEGKDEVCVTTTSTQVMSATPAPGCFPNGPVISCADFKIATRIDDPCDSDKTPSPVGPLCDRKSGQIKPLDTAGKDFDPPVNDPPTSSEGVGGTRLI